METGECVRGPSIARGFDRSISGRVRASVLPLCYYTPPVGEPSYVSGPPLYEFINLNPPRPKIYHKSS